MPQDNATTNRLTLSVHVEHDGHYWIARCPALKMSTAHQKKPAAWMRAVRVFPAQIVYALNNDPALNDLIPDPEHAEALETLRKFHRERKAFTLSLEEVSAGYKAEIPDLLAAAR